MIVDNLNNLSLYVGVHRNFPLVFEYVCKLGIDALPIGKYPLHDESLGYVTISTDDGRDSINAYLEAHCKYIDLQIVLGGVEGMGWKCVEDCTRTQMPYSEEKDIKFFADKPDFFINLKPYQFVIFFPADAHMPLIGTTTIRKAIVKIRC